MVDDLRMRGNEITSAILALIAGVALVGPALGAFLVFVGDGGGEASAPRGRVAEAPAKARPNCLVPDECRVPSAELVGAYDDTRACDGETRRVCLFLVGDVPTDLVDHLVAYYQDEYDLTLHVLPLVTLEPGFAGGRQRQLQASFVKDRYTVAYPKYSLDRNVLLIGLTPIDIYTADRPEWKWFFGQLASRHAVISVFRMDPVNWGERRDDNLRNKRVRTLMNKYIAMGYYGLPLNDNPRSVLYRQIASLETLDRIDQRIPVPQQRKD
jgi:hypothetical protein